MLEFVGRVARFATLCVFCFCAVAGEAGELSELTRVPNLFPTLSREETATAFEPWKRHAEAIISQRPSEEMSTMVSKARTTLASKLPESSKITFYSLHPETPEDLRGLAIEEAIELRKLASFHDYPVLGKVELDDPKEIHAWTKFLRSQVIPGPLTLCDFEPRHGIRFTTATGDVDMLICFTCSQLAVHGGQKVDQAENPMFSIGVQDLLNCLFDKRSIKRNIPSAVNQKSQSAR